MHGGRRKRKINELLPAFRIQSDLLQESKITMIQILEGQMSQNRPHMERALFVLGNQNAGKSKMLRHMFIDPRLGTSGNIPEKKIIKLVSLSRDRCLHVRCTSPHEMKETMDVFFEKLDHTMERAWDKYWRFNLACAMQPSAANKMPDIVTTFKAFREKFEPERIRVIQINPRQDEDETKMDLLSHSEVAIVDGRRPAPNQYPNGFFLADFFDFN
jgi:hypothetical protein